MAKPTVILHGDKGLEARLKALSRDAFAGIMRAAMQPVLEIGRVAVVRSLAATLGGRKRTWKLTGEVLRSIGTSLRITSKPEPRAIGKFGAQRVRGGGHAHLLEHGHKIVRGGTLERPGRTPSLTAAGKRLLATYGLERAEGKAGRKGAWRYTGKRPWPSRGLTPGATYRIGRTLFGSQVRGGGRAMGKVPGYPFFAPAWARVQSQIGSRLEAGLRAELDAYLKRIAPTAADFRRRAQL